MATVNRKTHWNKIYDERELTSLSWYQQKPEPSLSIIASLNLPKNAAIMDAGGGDSLLVDYLLKMGYSDISVLDISETAIEKAKKRVGEASGKVKWISADVSRFTPTRKYDLWHDRAAFHFLTGETERDSYLQMVRNAIVKNGYLVIGTFSETGPDKCSGLEVKKYSESSLGMLVEDYFKKLNCFTIDHLTPANKIQNFLFCSFIKK